MEIISGENLSDWLQPKMNFIHDHCGIIFTIDERNTGFNRGTVTFIKINDIEGMLIAYHVYESIKDHNVRIYCNLQEQSIELPSKRIYSKELDYIWFPLTLFDKLDHSRVKFFNIQNSQYIIEMLRNTYKMIDPDDAAKMPSFFLLNGCPNFAASHDKIENIQEFSLQPIHVQFRQFEDIFMRKTQIGFEFDSKNLEIKDKNKKIRFTKTFNCDSFHSPMGGYSGGPACAFGIDGIFLIGIICECHNFDSLFKIVVNPITEIVEDIKNKNNN
jgi:hypothetical protein